MAQQLNFPWFNYQRFIEKEITVNVEFIKTMLGNAPRIEELLARREEIDAEQSKLTTERAEIDAELTQLTGQAPIATNGTGRKCALCGEAGHIIGRKKTADGGDTCKTYPNGKPKE